MKNKKNISDTGHTTHQPGFIQPHKSCDLRAGKLCMTSDRVIFPDDLQTAASHQKSLNTGKLTIYLK